jgi:hypothetical protein
MDQVETYFNRIKKCGSKIVVGDRLISRRCKKLGCPRCGGKNHFLHKTRIKAVKRRIAGMRIHRARQLVFTLPFELRREYFMSRDALNRFFNIVRRIIEKYFGVFIRVKNQKKGECLYRLDEHVVATLHLFGRESTYHPHIHVLIFEKSGSWSSLRIDDEKLSAIKKSYRKALGSLLKKKIDIADVKYVFDIDPYTVQQKIWYVTKPFPLAIFEEIQLDEDT